MKKTILFLMMTLCSLGAATLDEKVSYLENIKELVILTQEMRGDTNVYIKGGDVKLSKITDKHEVVAASLRELRQRFETVDVQTNEKFNKLNTYMISLNEVAAELDTMTTFRAYSLLINEMIKLGVKVQSNFFINDNKRRDISSVMMQDILPMTEGIGRVRGLGAGMAACNQCNSDEVAFTKDHFTNVSDHLEKLVADMRRLNALYPNSYPKNLEKQLVRYQVDVKRYIELMKSRLRDEEFGQVPSISLDSYDFFSHGTSLIDHTLSFYEMNELLLKGQ